MSRTMDQTKLQAFRRAGQRLKNDLAGHHSGNSRNGYSVKKLKGDHGEIDLQTPRDRNASFEPQLIKKGQARITGMDIKSLACTPKE